MAFIPSHRAQPVYFGDTKTTVFNMNGTGVSLSMHPGVWGALSIQMVWTEAPEGSLFVQYSNDNENWDDVTGTETDTSIDSSVLWILPDAIVTFVRVKFTYISGSGLLSGMVTTRDIK